MPRISLAAAAIGLFLVVAGTAASASEIDQEQINATAATGIEGPTEFPAGQSITPAIPGLLTEVQLPVSCEPTSTLRVEVRSHVGVPGPIVHAAEVVPGERLPYEGSTFRSIVFANPAFVAAEVPFALVLSATGPHCLTWGSPQNVDAYSRGERFFWDRGRQRWFGPLMSDLAFKTFVERRCRAPVLTRIPLDEAAELLARNGCRSGQIRRAYSRAVEAGSVISQSPAAGTILLAGSPVALVVSSGPPPCVVPRLRGKTLAQAKAALARANCRLGRVSRRAARGTRRGRVVAQRPAPGARRPGGSKVNLVLSRSLA